MRNQGQTIHIGTDVDFNVYTAIGSGVPSPHGCSVGRQGSGNYDGLMKHVPQEKPGFYVRCAVIGVFLFTSD